MKNIFLVLSICLLIASAAYFGLQYKKFQDYSIYFSDVFQSKSFWLHPKNENIAGVVQTTSYKGTINWVRTESSPEDLVEKLGLSILQENNNETYIEIENIPQNQNFSHLTRSKTDPTFYAEEILDFNDTKALLMSGPNEIEVEVSKATFKEDNLDFIRALRVYTYD